MDFVPSDFAKNLLFVGIPSKLTGVGTTATRSYLRLFLSTGDAASRKQSFCWRPRLNIRSRGFLAQAALGNFAPLFTPHGSSRGPNEAGTVAAG